MQHNLRSWARTTRLGAVAVLGGAGIYACTYVWDRHRNGPPTPSHLNPRFFTPYSLVKHHRISDTNSILVLRGPAGGSDAAGEPATFGQEKDNASPRLSAQDLWADGIWSVEVKQPQLMIARRYTPLPMTVSMRDANGSGALQQRDTPPLDYSANEITLLVRREPQGEVSRYLHALRVGASVELRGGYAELQIPESISQVIFIAGGTGIAPALQIAHVLAERGLAADMKVLWANRRRDECNGATSASVRPGDGGWGRSLWNKWMPTWTTSNSPSVSVRASQLASPSSSADAEDNPIVRQLDALASPLDPSGAAASSSSLSLQTFYFIDDEGTAIRQGDIERVLEGGTSSKYEKSRPGRRLVIVSGPDGFVEYIAGPKRLVNGVETQGKLGGLLARVDRKDWQVWKL